MMSNLRPGIGDMPVDRAITPTTNVNVITSVQAKQR